MSSNQTIKAIETRYAGCRFRSRLEARWACFFDALGVKWEYEPEGFELSRWLRYLPDFWLPKFQCQEGLYVEVKPEGGDFSLARQFALDTGLSILCAEGTPTSREYVLLRGKEILNDDIDNGVVFMDKYISGNNSHEYRLFSAPGWPQNHFENFDCFGNDVKNACQFARSARFEHGETPRFGV